ncbi:hypothetical protein HNY73_003099 [Argiope bruennichi]|uniref:Uncharacterized protein n=1 Tax=Argiope bruennichi TaxID=94029 RepID=A0A8T0FWZ2_ARGBR|nr:hypothetical protein HNY73_003099 [Argiope bruennichi]
MENEIYEKPGHRRSHSVKDYTSKVFKETSVSAISAIVSTDNVWRKIFRVLVFLLFTAGFLYQCIIFLRYLLQFPTNINLEMMTPDRYLSPAYTFCNFNPIKRREFCSKYPNSCVESDEAFCNSFPKLCTENNTKEGIFLRPGWAYLILVEMEEEELLPYPYRSDCLNYTTLWLNANKTGPRSQKMCMQRCYREFTEYCFNCTYLFNLYPSRKNNFCPADAKLSRENDEICREWENDPSLSCNKCKKDCTRMKYSYRVQELFQKRYERLDDDIRLRSQFIEVKIIFKDSKIMKIQHKPEYQPVEVFSYIGGFVGIWLGISFVQVVDVIESLFLITRYFLKKRPIKCSGKPISNV